MSARALSRLLYFVLWSMLLAAPARATGDDRLALQGFDPVAYFTLSQATPGDATIQFEWDGAIYRFASAEHRELFKADPDRYLPQFGNLCTASLAAGHKVQADPRYWLVRDGRLFLFGGPAGVEAMKGDPAAVKARAYGNFPALAASEDRNRH
jgi:YHS domain-containing protein